MRRVFVTGLGVVSSIGNECGEVLHSLRTGRSGMAYMPEMAAAGYRCCIAAPIKNFRLPGVPLAVEEELSGSARYALAAALEAAGHAGLLPHSREMENCGVLIGTGGGGQGRHPRLPTPEKRAEKPFGSGMLETMRQMNSTAAVAVACYFGAMGRTQSISAACATGLFNIGRAYELVRDGRLECCLTGGAEEETWRRVGVAADNTRGMPTEFNDNPTAACRPFDRDRQGFVISSGAGVMVLESEVSVAARLAEPYAEIVGYAAANDGADMFVATGEGMQDVLTSSLRQAARRGVTSIDYINAHAAGTRQGDPVEASVIARVLGKEPYVSSTKGHAGHSQGGVGGQEAVFTALMLREQFVAPSLNLSHIDPACAGVRHVLETTGISLSNVVTMNNGLGGANACLVLRKV